MFWKTKENQIKTFVWNHLSYKPTKFYMARIYKLHDKWREAIQFNGEYAIDWNWFII